ncbi:hypothetical protein [Burkholderia ambifaria]|uniref:hypothetical protein n=1 Tax=Burkholderia ambifaria TaxID=152480 RepID=UPI0002F05E69|nr:hypothetical protein [Burkholderia ambifaria]
MAAGNPARFVHGRPVRYDFASLAGAPSSNPMKPARAKDASPNGAVSSRTNAKGEKIRPIVRVRVGNREDDGGRVSPAAHEAVR